VLLVEPSGGVSASKESLGVDDGAGLVGSLGIVDTAELGGVLVSSRHNSGISRRDEVE
jgi:hypothetical protein